MNTSAFLPCTDGARLGLGGAPLGNLFEAMSDAQARAVVDVAWADGCRSFDTAPHYGHGLSERRLGDALRGHPRSSLRLSSKVGRLLTPQAQVPPEQHSYVNTLPFVQHWDLSASGVRRSVEDSLQRLGLAQLDAVYIHDIDAGTHGAQADAVLRRMGEVKGEIKGLRDEVKALDPEQRMLMMQKTGRRTVPQIYVGATHVGGFDDLSALDREGKLMPLLNG